MIELHNWLHDQLALANRSALQDTHRLIDERNAVLTELDPATAKRFTEAMARIRSSPTPIKTEEFLAMLRDEQLTPEAEGAPTDTDA